MASKFLDKFIAKLEKSDDSIVKFDNVDYFKDTSNWVSTGSPYLDFKLNTFGFPVGITEIRGESQGGKTTLSLHGLRNFQRTYPDGIGVILSTERRDNKQYAKDIGIDTKRIIIVQCKSIEDVFNKAQQIIQDVTTDWKAEKQEGKPKFFFVWDSLGNTISSQEKTFMIAASEDDNEEHHKTAMGSAARALKRGLRFMTAQIYDNDIWFCIINQVYDSMSGFGGGKSSYGGKGIKYAPNLRIQTTMTQTIKVKDEKRGQITTVEIIKSDFNSDKDKIDIEIMWGKGIILCEEDFQMGVEAGILEKHGKSGYSFMSGKLQWASKPALYALYDSNNKLLDILRNKLIKIAHDKVIKERSLNNKEIEEDDTEE